VSASSSSSSSPPATLATSAATALSAAASRAAAASAAASCTHTRYTVRTSENMWQRAVRVCVCVCASHRDTSKALADTRACPRSSHPAPAPSRRSPAAPRRRRSCSAGDPATSAARAAAPTDCPPGRSPAVAQQPKARVIQSKRTFWVIQPIRWALTSWPSPKEELFSPRGAACLSTAAAASSTLRFRIPQNRGPVQFPARRGKHCSRSTVFRPNGRAHAGRSNNMSQPFSPRPSP
jgi:hypothetical protein